jgi:hypothetical protein
MNSEKDDLKRLNKLIDKNPSAYSIFEDAVDIKVQKSFYEYMAFFSPEELIDNNNSLEEKEKLYDKNTSLEKKKELLALLSNIDKVEAYRTIEQYAKDGEEDLKEWTNIALQQSRMMLESTLLDEKSIFISTGLGGKERKLRYFCILFTNKVTSKPSRKEISIIREEIKFAFHKIDSVLESLDFTEGVISFKALIPMDANIKELFDNLIIEINNYGKILKNNMIITNVKALTIEEIEAILNKKSEE